MGREEIIALLVEARLKKGMSQAELARLIGTQRSNVCRLESGTQNPSLDMVLKIAAALGKTVSLSLEDSGEDMSKVYTLRIQNTTLMRFVMERRGKEGIGVEILSIEEGHEHLLPLDMERTDEGVRCWLERRLLPKDRAYADAILKTLHLNHGDTKAILDVSKGLSLRDSYWIVPDGFKGRFAQYSLFRNRFSEMLEQAAYTGTGQRRQEFTISPELTAHGTQPKAWHLAEGDGIYLYKAGSCGEGDTGREPYCEYYASQIAQVMQLNAVHYELEVWKDKTASKCALFTDPNTSFVPMEGLVREGGIRACLAYCDSLGREFGEQLRSMLLFDALIYNEGRHFGNFGLLRDSRTGKIMAPAPVFDHGSSLLCHAGEQDWRNFDALQEYAAARTNPYGIPFEELCAEVMGARQKEQLRRMMGFRFKRHPRMNLPEGQLWMLERLLEQRVRRLLLIPARRG